MSRKKNRKKKVEQGLNQAQRPPVLTIGIITDNSARFLNTTLMSVLAQRIKFPYEIVIVDNASIDQTQNFIKSFLEEHHCVATVHYLKEKCGYEALHKYLYEHSRGAYLLTLNGNDFLPDKTLCAYAVAFLKKNQNYSAICGRAQFVDIFGKPTATSLTSEKYCSGTEYMLRNLSLWQSPSFLNSLIYRRRAIERKKEFFESGVKSSIPFDKRFYMHLLVSGRIKVLPKVTYKHRCVGNEPQEIYSRGNKPYSAVNKAIIEAEKLSHKIYDVKLNFQAAKLRVWVAVCREYFLTGNDLLKKDIRKLFNTSPNKPLYRYWKERLRVQFKPKKGKKAVQESGVAVAEKTKELDFRTPPANKAKRANRLKGQAERRPMVSIGMTVYNQEDYVAQAIESILAQKVNFDYEIVIADDCSTDRTREIVIDYAKRYPRKIRLILQSKNVGLKAQSAMLRKICNGIYRTHLEGDDYWLTTDKLQKQVDFLETHRDYIAVTGKIKTVDEEGNDCDFPYGDIKTIYSFDPEYTLQHFEKWLLPSHTGALLYRNVYYDMDDKEREIYESADIAGDRKTALYLVMQGRIRCMQECISVRRIELNSPTNFTAVNRKAHPYTMIYKWMCDLGKFAYQLKGVNIDLTWPKEQQWIYALHYFMRNPSKSSLGHVIRIYNMSNNKRLYVKLLMLKAHDKFKRAVDAIGFVRVLFKWTGKAFKSAARVFIKENNKHKEMHKNILSGNAKK
ncbi:MAG: glycosyltransferase [Clostridia bacterium]|nr:glycosyltransferase [Clostridia bacterium]